MSTVLSSARVETETETETELPLHDTEGVSLDFPDLPVELPFGGSEKDREASSPASLVTPKRVPVKRGRGRPRKSGKPPAPFSQSLAPLHVKESDTFPASSPEYDAVLKARISAMVVARLDKKDMLDNLDKEGYKDVTLAHLTRLLLELNTEWAATAAENIEAAIGIELATLDAIQAELWPAVQAGDLKTTNTLISKIMNHRARLLGLYAPTRQNVLVRKVIVKAYAGVDIDKI